MSTATTERIYKLTVDSTQALNKLDQIAKSTGATEAQFKKLNGTMDGLSKTVKMVGGAFVALQAGLAVFGSMSQAFSRATEEIDNLGKASMKIGVTVESLSALKFVAEQSGVGFDSLTSALGKFNKNLAEVGDSTSTVGQAFRDFGVTTLDNTEQAFKKIADGFEKMPDGAMKTAKAMELFGKAGAELIPLLNGGGQSIEDLTKRAVELGLVLSQDTVDRITSFNDSLAEMRKSQEGVTNQLVAGMAPALQSLADMFAKSTSVGGVWMDVGEGIGKGLIWLTQQVDSFVTAIRMMISGLSTAIEMSKQLLSFDFKGIKTTFVDGVGKVEDMQKSYDDRKRILDDYQKNFSAVSRKIASVGESTRSSSSGKGKTGKTQEERDAEAIQKKIEAMKIALDPMYAYQKAIEDIQLLESAGLDASYANLAKIEASKKYSEAMTGDIQKREEAMTKEAQAIKELLDPYKKLNREIEGYQALLQNGNITTEEYIAIVKKQKEATDDLVSGVDKSRGQFQELTDAMAGYTSSFVGSFIDDLGRAEASFEKFVAGLLKTIAKLMMNRMMQDFMKQFLGAGGIGGFSFTGSTSGTKSLAPVESSPTMFRSGSPSMTPMMAGMMKSSAPANQESGTVININNNNAKENEVTTKETTNDKGQKQIEIFIEKKVKDMFGSGGMDKTMKASYGLRRSPV